MALMVHDLKNPLAALMANLTYVRTARGLPDAAAEAIDDCLLSAEALGLLIENLATVSRCEAGELHVAGEASVEEVLRAVDARMKRYAGAAEVPLETSCAPGCGSVAISAPLLALAIENLVASSISYAPSRSAVRLRAERHGARVRISVEDDGPELAEAMRPLVFDLDGQARLKGAAGARYGRGFGLFVASAIAKAGGGALEVPPRTAGCSLELVLPCSG